MNVKDINFDELTEKDFKELLDELKAHGYIANVKADFKNIAIKIALEKRGAKRPYVANNLSKGIYSIADYLLDNYGEKGGSVKYLPADMEKREKYISLVDGIIEAMFPYYGKTGFRNKERNKMEVTE